MKYVEKNRLALEKFHFFFVLHFIVQDRNEFVIVMKYSDGAFYNNSIKTFGVFITQLI